MFLEPRFPVSFRFLCIRLDCLEYWRAPTSLTDNNYLLRLV